MGEDKIKILAYLIAEGHLSNGFVLFSNKDDSIIHDFNNAVMFFDSALAIKNHSKEFCFRVVNNGLKRRVAAVKRDKSGRFPKGVKFEKRNSLRLWLESLGIYNKLSREKFIPNCIFKLPKHELSLFLNRIFSCDGTIYFDSGTSAWRVAYGSSSEQLIRQIHHLLLRFSILSKIRFRKKTASYELELRGENVTKFLDEIGFFGAKELKQKKALRESERIKPNPNVDTIPKEIWDFYRPENWADVGRAAGYAHPKAFRSSLNYAPSRQKLQQIAVLDDNHLLNSLANSDIFWDEILFVERLEGEFDVYDISVPNQHNFIANDIIVHNSYTMGVIAEGMADLPPDIKNNLSIILLDTMGIYWTMKYDNHKERDLLDIWKLKPKPLDPKIYTPIGYFKKYKDKGIPTDFPFSIQPSELDASDWNMTFGIGAHEPVGVLIERAIYDLKEKMPSFGLKEIIKAIDSYKDADLNTKNAAKNQFVNAGNWGVFADQGTPLKDLAKPGQITVLDVSCYATMPNSWNIKSLVIGLVAEKLFIERMLQRRDEEFEQVHKATHYYTDETKTTQDYPLVWLVIDEAHEFLPVIGKTLATDPLVTILREGRQPGISLVLATQQPGKIHTDVMTQSDIILSHRITAKLDTDALGMLMQSYMRQGLPELLDDLPRENGAALILDDNNEKMYPMRVRPRFTWHGGESPIAMKEKKE
ncbi:MAG: LAGLIDADG family homing endonuclease [Candidatus Woesearchaeota archaeon]